MVTVTSGAVPGFDEEADTALEEGFAPLTAEQARQWRQANPPFSPWPVLGVQTVAGLVTVLVTGWLAAAHTHVVWSAAWGVLAAWLPALIFARAMARRMQRQGHAMGALVALMVWEGIKIVLTVALLLAAPRVLAQVSWPALVAGFVITIKAAWLALWWFSAKRQRG